MFLSIPTEKSSAADRRKFEIVKQSFEDGTAIAYNKQQSAALGAASFAFFLALFSAGTLASESKLLIISEACFAVGLVANMLIFLVYQGLFSREEAWWLNLTPIFSKFQLMGVLVPGLGTFFLVLHYSWFAAVSGFVVLISVPYVISQSAKQKRDIEDELDRIKAEHLKNNNNAAYDIISSNLKFVDSSKVERYKYSAVDSNNNLIEDINLNSPVLVGDSIILKGAEKYVVLRKLHDKKAISLVCQKDSVHRKLRLSVARRPRR